MTGDEQDRDPESPAGSGDRETRGAGWTGSGAGQASPAYPPVSGHAGLGPQWPESPAGWGGHPGMGGMPPGQGRGGLFKQHPLLMIFLILLVAAAFIAIFATAIGQSMGSGGLTSVSFGKRVGVIKIEGVIMESKPAVDEIRRFMADDSIAAVVLRVNSPGGDVGASQEIHKEVERLANIKPVVVSMGSVAASGGYYVSCPAKKIFANEGTITGSIGVIMQITDLEGLFEWMKVKNIVIKSGEYKDVGSPHRDVTVKEKAYLQSVVDNLHQQFEEAVAAGRAGLDAAKVHELANGKMYTGVQARDLGLIDEIGTLWDAIHAAAELGGIEGEPKVAWPPKRAPTLLGSLIGELFPGGTKPGSLLGSPVRVMYILQ